MKRRLLLFLAAICAVVVLWMVFGGQKRRFTLADGTTVTFYGVSVGTSNRYCFGNPARRLAAKLPWSWAQKFAASAVLTAPVDGNTNLVIWVTYRGIAPRGGPFRFRCVHDGGTCELVFDNITKYGLPSGEAGTGYSTPFWPRRSKRLTLQALEDFAPAGTKLLWEVCVSNPLRLDEPPWQPEPLPACRTVDDVTVCLERLVLSETRSVTIAAWQRLDTEWVQARLRLTRNGQPDTDWQICSMHARGALGNPFRSFHQLTSRIETHDLDFVLPLLFGERAGKLGVAFARVRRFPTNELFTLPELKLPATGWEVVETLRTITPFGEISIYVIAYNMGTGMDVSILSRQPPGLDFANPNARWFQPLAATDDGGRTHLPTAYGAPGIQESSMLHLIRLPPDARKLVLTVAATRMMFVEFTVGRENITRPK